MKKLLMVLALFSIFSMTVVAQEKDQDSSEKKWSEMSYVNVPVLKVLEGREAYIVVYQKNKVGVGQAVIPKKWIKGTPDEPRKLKLRNAKTSNDAYMTVQKKNGDFHRVVLTLPMNKLNPIWGVADYHRNIDGSDKDTLEELDL